MLGFEPGTLYTLSSDTQVCKWSGPQPTEICLDIKEGEAVRGVLFNHAKTPARCTSWEWIDRRLCKHTDGHFQVAGVPETLAPGEGAMVVFSYYNATCRPFKNGCTIGMSVDGDAPVTMYVTPLADKKWRQEREAGYAASDCMRKLRFMCGWVVGCAALMAAVYVWL